MWKLSTVNDHHSVTSMSSHTSYMRFKCVGSSHALGVWNDMGHICLILVHTIYDEACILGGPFLCLTSVLGILFPLSPVESTDMILVYYITFIKDYILVLHTNTHTCNVICVPFKLNVLLHNCPQPFPDDRVQSSLPPFFDRCTDITCRKPTLLYSMN